METGSAFLVNIELLLHEFIWIATFYGEVKCDVFEVEETGEVERSTSKLILLHKHLQDIVLVELLITLAKSFDNVGKLATVDHWEDAGTLLEIFSPQANSQVHQLLLIDRYHLSFPLNLFNFC